MKKIYISKSKIAGRGIFAGEDIKKHEFVAPLIGKLVHRIYKKPSDWRNESTWIPVAIHWWINPGFPMRYINHSCEPTVGFKTPRRAYALRDIKKGEEITIDYSTIEYTSIWSSPCRCGSKKCRGVIRSIQFLPPRVYKKNLPYIPRFLQKIYRRRHSAVR